jgi:hypothetical protein
MRPVNPVIPSSYFVRLLPGWRIQSVSPSFRHKVDLVIDAEARGESMTVCDWSSAVISTV